MIVRNPSARQRKPKPDHFADVPPLLMKLLDPNAPEQDIKAAIYSRLIPPGQNRMTSDAARAVLNLQIDPADHARMHELAVKNQDGALSTAEEKEMHGYIRLSELVDLLRAKAVLALKG